jgi:hypothetical protein
MNPLSLHSILFKMKVIELPYTEQEPAVYFNLTGIVGKNQIVDASHDNSKVVRTATISQKYKLMTLTFYPRMPRQNVAISITHKVGSEEIETTFNITAGAANVTVISTNSTTLEAASNSTSTNSTETQPPVFDRASILGHRFVPRRGRKPLEIIDENAEWKQKMSKKLLENPPNGQVLSLEQVEELIFQFLQWKDPSEVSEEETMKWFFHHSRKFRELQERKDLEQVFSTNLFLIPSRKSKENSKLCNPKM